MNTIIILFILSLSISHAQNLGFGFPIDADGSDDYLMHRIVGTDTLYSLSYNKNLNIPNWVSWELTKTWYGDAERYKGNFIKDNTLPSGFYRVSHDDYTNSGYDRGHLVRSEERTRNDEHNKATFYMTNILPQVPELNREAWLGLEYFCEQLCKEYNSHLRVIAGGFSYKKKINDKVAIPDTCYKIIVIGPPGLTPRTGFVTIAVKMPNNAEAKGHHWSDYICTIDGIEASTGYDFLNEYEKNEQSTLEKQRYIYLSIESEGVLEKKIKKIIRDNQILIYDTTQNKYFNLLGQEMPE